MSSHKSHNHKSHTENPRTKSYEFLGPPGTFLASILVPTAIYALYFGCSESAGCPPPLPVITDNLRYIKEPDWWKGLWDIHAFILYLGWYAFCVIAWFLLPGDWIEGEKLRTGVRKKYKINGILYSLRTVFNLLIL